MEGTEYFNGFTFVAPWQDDHAQDCAVTIERADLAAALEAAAVGRCRHGAIASQCTHADCQAPGAFESWKAGLLGAVPEYEAGGDQEMENCSCGAVDHREQQRYVIRYGLSDQAGFWAVHDTANAGEIVREFTREADAVDFANARNEAESPAEELGRLRRELSEYDYDTPERAMVLDRISVLTRERAVERRAVKSVAIPVPFEGDQPLEVELTPDGSYHNDMRHLYLNISEEDAARVFTAATVLYHSQAGSFAECLHTALVWECG